MVAVVRPAIQWPSMKAGCMVSDFRFKFELGQKITFLRAMIIMLGVAYVGCFMAGLMCISLIALIGIGLDKLGFLDFRAVVSPYAVAIIRLTNPSR
jgi:hypothetical protein